MLLALNGGLAACLAALLGYQLFTLRQKLKAGVFGAKLTLRLVILFALVAVRDVHLQPLAREAALSVSLDGVPVTGCIGFGDRSAMSNVQPSDRRLRRGDVIVRANSRTVNAASDLAAEVDAARKAGRPSVLIGVNRDGRTLFLPLDIKG